jgi:hypothetical protein
MHSGLAQRGGTEMTANKAIEILNKMYDRLLIEGEIYSDVIEIINDKRIIYDRLNEIADKEIALLTAIDALKERGKTK